MFRKLIGSESEAKNANKLPNQPADTSPEARSREPDKQGTEAGSTDQGTTSSTETYRYWPGGDSELRKTIVNQLFAFGLTEDSPQVAQASMSDLLDLGPKLADKFWVREQGWLADNLTNEDLHNLRQSISDHGIGTSYDMPIVSRPMDYSILAGHSVNSLETAWKLIDRGIEVAITAMDRHFCYLNGLKAGNLFFDAGKHVLEHKRLTYAKLLRANRDDAIEDFFRVWKEPPPGLGQEYDYLEFTQAANRISVPYRDRDRVEGALNQAIEACHQMISRTHEFKTLFAELEMELPIKHHGFYQLAVILDNQKRWREAIDFCRQAVAEGWPGDWDVRIARYEKRLATANKKSKQKSPVSGNVVTIEPVQPTIRPMFCDQCGNELEGDAKFCPQCGSKIE